jgi:hypothetical protein
MEEKPIRKEKYPDKNNLIQHHDLPEGEKKERKSIKKGTGKSKKMILHGFYCCFCLASPVQ